MSDSSQTDQLLIERIRKSDAEAWNELIARFEGRLLAFVESRANHRAAAEDIVQETFIGFLTSLPNYDARRSLESYLFSIAAHKLTDHLRREGRRPTVPLAPASSRTGSWEQPGSARPASSILRSGERRGLEETALVEGMGQQIARWRERGDWEKLQCLELLLVRGWANKDVAAKLQISEQAVANHKFQFVATLRASVRRQELPEEVFPELYAKD
ncbi:MAG: RNA polymerase sigma factor [Pirellulales bacterium]|nr:RNA polymerase sigma factor [Pirellulales bacterium]